MRNQKEKNDETQHRQTVTVFHMKDREKRYVNSTQIDKNDRYEEILQSVNVFFYTKYTYIIYILSLNNFV